ncbi:tail fiber assembly protein [Pseudomonas sp. App30]|uniref:tail fiber assembly protein n=1 Tax=Pseudomonas sp. App30 TaxID=3068990 RepID=UPI003A805DFC
MEETYASVENGAVTNIIVWDGVPFTAAVEPDEDGNGGSPAQGYTPPTGVTLVAIGDTGAGIGWTYDGKAFAPPAAVVPTAAEILSANTQMRDSLLSVAALAIAPLQDAVDLNTATAAETAALKTWKQYRVAVNRVDLTAAGPAWPAQPT